MSSSTTFSFVFILIAAILVAGPSASLGAEGRHDVIRVLHSELARTLDDVYVASASARALVDQLERSDLLIHVIALGMDRRHRFTGTMKFVVRAGGRRLLRITIDDRLPADRRAAALAHELQHAAEIAHAAWVVDHASFASLYRDIGHESGGNPYANCFETIEAFRLGARVLAEFRAATALSRHEARVTGEGK